MRYLVGIGNPAVAAGEDDGDGGRDEGVGAPDDGGEARAEEALNQRVDPGDEQQRLDHPSLLLLAERQCRNRSSVFFDMHMGTIITNLALRF